MKNILDQQAQSAICGILAVGGSFDLAARYAGCSRKTIYNTANRDPKFHARLKQSQTCSEIQHLNTIHEAGRDVKNWNASKWLLQHKYPERYARRAQTMPFNDVRDLIGQVTHAVVSRVTDPTLRKSLRMAIRGVVGPYFFKAKGKLRAK